MIDFFSVIAQKTKKNQEENQSKKTNSNVLIYTQTHTHTRTPQPYIDIYLKASHTLQEDKSVEKKNLLFVQEKKKRDRLTVKTNDSRERNYCTHTRA